MSAPRVELRDIVAEKATCRITGKLVDELGAALGSSQLATLTMTLYALVSGFPILNSNTDKDILNANQGTVDSSGNLVLTLLPADNPIQDDANSVETHRALLKWTYGGGAKAGAAQIEFKVLNLTKVT